MPSISPQTSSILVRQDPGPLPARVLIVEDEGIVAEDLLHKVANLGYRVVGIFPTGEEAIHAAQQFSADLVLLDLQLAGDLNGVQTAEQIHQLCDAAVVFITAHSDTETVKKANATGPFGYILKPFGDRDLAVQLAVALHKHRADRALRAEIAERQQAQKQLQKSEAILLRAQLGAKAGVWEIDLRTGQFTWSKPYYDLFDLDRSVQPSLDVWLSRIHPEDRSRIAAEHKESIEGHRDQDMEFRILKSDGTVRWIHRKGQVEFNEQGEAISIDGISFDITERKHAEEAVSAVALFPAQNPSPVLRVNGAGVLIYMNPASDGLLEELHLQLGQSVPPDLRVWVEQSLEMGRSTRVEYDIASCHYFITITPIVKENYANLYWTDITERKHAEIALRESERRFRDAADAAPVLIWISDRTKLCTWFNRPWLEFTGRTMGQELGYGLAESVHADDLKRYLDIYSAAFDERQPFIMEYPLRRYDGQYRWILDHGTPRYAENGEFLGYIGSCIDITDRKLAEEQLVQNQGTFTELVQRSPFGIYIVDSAFRISHMNDAGQRGAFRNVRPVIGRDIAEAMRILWPEPVAADVIRVFRHTLDTGEPYYSRDFINPRADIGQTEGYEWELHRLTLPNGQHGVICYYFDSTKLRETEAALREIQYRLKQWNEELGQAVNVKTAELVQSQERLRALATELNLAEQRERKRLAMELHDHLQQMLVLGKLTIGQGKRFAAGMPACENVLKKVDDVLSDALTYTRTLVADLSPPALREQGLAAGLKWLGESMKKHDLMVTVTVPEDRSLKLPEDQTLLLFQSVRELLINSSKHAGTGQAVVEWAENDKRLEITVRDEGGGFDPAAADTISSAGVSSKFGLFSIRERMKAIGGWFDIQSSPGKGTCATLALPLPTLSESPRKAPLEILVPRPNRVPDAKAILLIDGNDKDRQFYSHRLKVSSPHDYVIFEAATGQAGLDLLKAHPIDCVILELDLPDISGFEVLTKLVPIAQRPEIPVVVLTRFNNESLIKVASLNGAFAALHKSPTCGDELDIIVHKALGTIPKDHKKTS